MLKIRPYKLGSGGAALLASACSALIQKTVWRTTRPAALKRATVINWGSVQRLEAKQVFNKPDNVLFAQDKLKFFHALGERFSDFLPTFTTDKAVAKRWIEQGNVVYCRKTATGQGGAGIVVAKTQEELISVPEGGFYSLRFKNSCEFRIHVAFGKVIQIIQKKKRNGVEDNGFIRSNNNWVFARNLSVPCPEDLQKTAVAMLAELGLDFGAFDIAYSRRSGKYVVLEVNSAPGLDHHSAEVYAQAFVKAYKGGR